MQVGAFHHHGPQNSDGMIMGVGLLDGCYVVSDQVKLYILFLWMSIDMNINIKVDEEYLDIDIYTSTVCAFAKCRCSH